MKTIFKRSEQIGPEVLCDQYPHRRHTYTIDLGNGTLKSRGEFYANAASVLEILSVLNREGEGVFPLSGLRRREHTSKVVVQCGYYGECSGTQREFWIVFSAEEMDRDAILELICAAES